LRVETPQEVIQGQTFRINIFVDSHNSQLANDTISSIRSVQITDLALICTTSTRTAGAQHSSGSSPVKQQKLFYDKKRPFKAISLQSGPRVTADGSELEFSFEATMQAYYSPTFRSFLISNTYQFQSPIKAKVNGKTVQLHLTAPEVNVLSSVVPSSGLRRPSTMSTQSNNGRNGSTTVGRRCSYI